MAPEGVEELSEEALERQCELKQEAADALEDGNQELALDKFTQAIVLGCASALMYSRRGQILLKLGRPYAAVNDCTAAILVDSELASAYKTRARALSKLEQWADADSDFQEALKLNYDDATYQESLVVATKLGGGADAAPSPEAEAGAGLGGEPAFPPLAPPGVTELSEEARDLQIGLKQECSDALEDGELDAALEKISEAIALGCASALMYCTRADVLLKLERPRAAVNDCGAALAINPELAKAFKVRGRALAALEQWTDAHSNFQEALKIDYDEATEEDCRKAAARAKQAATDGGAVAVPEEAPEAQPEVDQGDEPAFPAMSPADVRQLTDEAQDRQADLKQECSDAMEAGDEQLALEKITEAIAIGCANALMYCRRAQLLVQLERPRAAVRDCSAALALNSNSGKALKIRARAFAAIERWQEAQADYQRALKIDYDDVVNEEALAVTAKLKQIEEAAVRASRRRWEIIGGLDKGGLVVREGIDLNSRQVLDALSMDAPHRLATGSTVAEIELVGDRLHYEKLTGSGPKEGWISITLKEKVLAIPVSASAPAEEEQLELATVEEPPFPAMSPAGVTELSDQAQEKQAELKQQAADALEDGESALALEHLTAAIALGCAGALLYCRRAQLLLKLGRPRAAANDCTAALAINPDSGKAFKIRARAHAKLKHWESAHSDFQVGLRIDYDEETYEESLAVEAKNKGIKAVAAEKRLQLEEDKEKRKIAEEKAQEEQRKKAEQELAALKAKEMREMRMFEAMYMRDQFGRIAWQQGYMTDFMGAKRGKCKCKKCPIYCWTPVRMSS